MLTASVYTCYVLQHETENQNMYHVLDTFLKDLPLRQPLAYKAVYPKRIIPPKGYLNPKYFTATLWSEMRVGYMPEMRMLPHVTGLVNCLLQMEYRVPTYFVRSEFAQAVAQTEPPNDFKLGEIHWPLPAMLFVLPTEFVLRYFGFMCPFLSVTRSDKGRYPAVLKNLPKCETPLNEINMIDNEVDRFNVVYPVYSKNQVPIDYTGSYPLSMNVNEMDAAPYQDATFMEESRMPFLFDNIAKHASDLPAEGEPERLFNSKVQAFAVKLMLVLNAAHDVVKLGTIQRPQKIKRGNIILDELWNPNLVGWDYRAQRVGPTSGEHGTHASPRMHWRRGHMRNQPYGPKPWTETSTKRLTWIEPVLINAPDETKKENV